MSGYGREFMAIDLDTEIQYLKGVGPRRASAFQRLGVETVLDLVHHYPHRYEDRRDLRAIISVRPGETATVGGLVVSVASRRVRRGLTVVTVMVDDGTAAVEVLFWNQPWRAKQFSEGDRVFLSGKTSARGGLQMSSPDFEIVEDSEDAGPSLDVGRIVPVHPLSQGLTAGLVRRAIRRSLDAVLDRIEDPMDAGFRESRRLAPLAKAIATIHFPETLEDIAAAERRLKYDELFLLEISLAIRRNRQKTESDGIAFNIDRRVDERIRRLFPFELTAAQERSIREIADDMRSPQAMNRMLQGDVGAGKTVVALYAILAAVANKYQTAFMAPTEILAEQHHATLMTFLRHARVRVMLLQGGLTGKTRREELARIAEGEVDIVVGTHALIQKDVAFENLGLVVVDEQHKFGVDQRAALRAKGETPDVLIMTATPIPRTLTLTVFGDLDVSIIDEMPPGRRPVKTRAYRGREIEKAYDFIRKEAARGHRAFFIYPLVEETEDLDLKAATEEAERLATSVFPEFAVGLLHGRMTRPEKEDVMRRFRTGEISILVSTVVVEVGIDVPEATVLVVEHADRFGLSQLHQLRGRIGRSDRDAWCLLFGDPKSEDGRRRLQTLVRTSDGFEIAEEDLRMRGPGEVMGTRQHGLPALRIANLVDDLDILREARQDAFDLVRDDPTLSDPAHAAIRRAVRDRHGISYEAS
jgi:ATP-dependent DNA helicase RecG